MGPLIEAPASASATHGWGGSVVVVLEDDDEPRVADQSPAVRGTISATASSAVTMRMRRVLRVVASWIRCSRRSAVTRRFSVCFFVATPGS
ncbi:MAG: hypothetical protein R2695_07605 [Acidimicrobiales bacterium]